MLTPLKLNVLISLALPVGFATATPGPLSNDCTVYATRPTFVTPTWIVGSDATLEW